jgi:5'-methylthioadenosine phosphorylase
MAALVAPVDATVKEMMRSRRRRACLAGRLGRLVCLGAMKHTLGVIGGSGLYDIEGLTAVSEHAVETPYGKPSDAIVSGTLGDTRLLFLPRHGRGHRVAPHAINFRANVCALKMLGATHLVTVSAVGSMHEIIAPGHLVVPDQFIDLTKRRVGTFFDEGVVSHVSFADPVCADLATALGDAASRAGGVVHRGGTYVCIEGPAFSTRAESLLYRSWNVSVIGMTAMPEARLAREAELPYSVLALATDYDAWHLSEAAVDVAAVVATLGKNVALARRTIAELAGSLPDPSRSKAVGAARSGIMTHPSAIDPAARKRLDWLLGAS